MRTLQLGLMTAVLCLGVGEAQAQGGAFAGPVDGIEVVAGIVGGVALGSALFTGGLTTWHVKNRTRSGVFVPAMILGTAHTAVGVGVIGFAFSATQLAIGTNPTGYAALGVGLIAVGLWNMVLPIVGFARGKDESSGVARVAPVVVGGKRSTGFGVAVRL